MQSVPGENVSILRGHNIGHSKQKLCICPISNSFRDRDMDVVACIKERQDALRRATRHVLTRVAKCIEVDGENFEKKKKIVIGKLYQSLVKEF
jgi:hypothetical protein